VIIIFTNPVYKHILPSFHFHWHPWQVAFIGHCINKNWRVYMIGILYTDYKQFRHMTALTKYSRVNPRSLHNSLLLVICWILTGEEHRAACRRAYSVGEGQGVGVCCILSTNPLPLLLCKWLAPSLLLENFMGYKLRGGPLYFSWKCLLFVMWRIVGQMPVLSQLFCTQSYVLQCPMWEHTLGLNECSVH
jgi:hypothetical protein